MKLNTKTSIIDFLKNKGEDSSFSARKKIAKELGIENYRGTAEQNKKLIEGYQVPEKENKSEYEIAKEFKGLIDSGADKQVLSDFVRANPEYRSNFNKLLEKTYGNKENYDKGIRIDTDGKENKSDNNTEKLSEKYGPESTIFPQYEGFNIGEDERKNIEDVQRGYYSEFFDRERDRSTEDYSSTIKGIDRLIGYAKTDNAKALADNNKTFAKTMSRATKMYGSRNLLGSGIMKQGANDAVGDLEKAQTNREEYDKRKMEGYEDRKDNIKTQYERGMTNIDENQDAQTYFDTLKEIRNRQNEFTRQFAQSQENVDFNLTTPTKPTNPYSMDEANKKTLDSNYR